MVWVSDHVLQAMGFDKYPQGVTVKAKFHCIKIMQVNGLAWTNLRSRFRRIELEGCSVTISIGNSINRMCDYVLGDRFTDDEQKWANEKSCSPPYVMLFFSLDEFSQRIASWHFTKGDEIHTYQTFSSEKLDIKKLEAKIVPRIITSLSCALGSASAEPVALSPVDIAYFGTTPDGTTVHDISFDMNAKLTVNGLAPSRKITNSLNQIEDIARSLDKQACEFFHDATAEIDGLKRFLFFFLFIERQTHFTFKSSISKAKPRMATVGSWNKEISQLSYFREIEKTPHLSDRFIWCVNFVWHRVSGAEIIQFLHLKKVRDDIAHGNARRPNSSDVASVEALAKKLFRPK